MGITMSKLKTLTAAMSVALVTSYGCYTQQAPAPSTGTLVDSEVVGINFSTATQSGTTNINGEFTYRPGETITFSVGGIDLPPVLAEQLITPLQLAASELVNDETSMNIARFLQSIDEDGNPENGIQISAETHAAAANLSLDFEQSAVDFAADADLTALLEAIQAVYVEHADARDHLESTISDWFANTDFEQQINDGINSFLATYVRGEGFTTAELADTCKDIDVALLGGTETISMCFNADGTSTTTFFSYTSNNTWSIDAEGAVVITTSGLLGDWTTKMIRLSDGRVIFILQDLPFDLGSGPLSQYLANISDLPI